MPDVGIRSTIAAINTPVEINLEDNPRVGIDVSGTWVGVIDVQATINGTRWETPKVESATGGTGVSQFTPDGATANGSTFALVGGYAKLRLNASAWTSGTATIVLRATDSAGGGGSGGGGGGGTSDTTEATQILVKNAVVSELTLTGAVTEAAPATDTASSGLNGRLQRIAQRLTSLIALLPASLGGTTSAGSLPVVLSSDGPFATQTGSVTEAAPATDTASSGLNGRLQRIAQRLTSLIALLPTSLGAKTAANSLAVTLATDDESVALTGAVTETAPANDTASSGLNGRLQRIAQRLTSLIALLPSALISNRLDVNLGAAPATVTVQGAAATGSAPVGPPALAAGIDNLGNVLPFNFQSAANPNLRVIIQNSGNSAAVPSSNVDGVTATAGLKVNAETYGYNGATWDRLRVESSSQQNLRTAIYSGAAIASVVTPNADTQSSGASVLGVANWNHYFGGTSYERARNNVDVTLLASAARTTTQTSADIITYNTGAIVITLDVTTNASGSITLSIDGKDGASGKYQNLLTGLAVASATGTFVYVIDPAIPDSANSKAQRRLPRTIRIVVTANNANSATYSVGYVIQPC